MIRVPYAPLLLYNYIIIMVFIILLSANNYTTRQQRDHVQHEESEADGLRSSVLITLPCLPVVVVVILGNYVIVKLIHNIIVVGVKIHASCSYYYTLYIKKLHSYISQIPIPKDKDESETGLYSSCHNRGIQIILNSFSKKNKMK